jgi:hypothetical protein
VADAGGEIRTLSGTSLAFANLVTDWYSWSVRAHACGYDGSWSPARTFRVDADPPGLPGNVQSLAHTVQQWSTTNSITMLWDAATDGCEIDKYAVLWGGSPTTVPVSNPSTDTGLLFAISSALPDGQTWFHIAARDKAGNLSPGAVHVGPYWIDATAPVNPSLTASLPTDEWGPFGSATVDWEAAVDPTSGVAGYSYLWSGYSSDAPDQQWDTSGLTAAFDLLPEGQTYFHLASLDNAGNWSQPVHLGPFLVDRTAPVVQLDSPGADSDGGATFVPIVELDDSNPSSSLFTYDWLVPFAPTEEGYVRVQVFDAAGNSSQDVNDIPFTILLPAGTAAPSLPTVTAFGLPPNVPNPFNPATMIRFAVPYGTHVQLCIFDAQGRLVRTLVDDWRNGPAEHRVTWNGTDDRGRVVAGGVYTCRIRASGFEQTRRMTLVK